MIGKIMAEEKFNAEKFAQDAKNLRDSSAKVAEREGGQDYEFFWNWEVD